MNKQTNGNLKDTKRGGFYWKESKFYPSVTQVLSIMDKPALRYWFGEQVYLAFSVDPTLSKQEALQAPWKLTQDAKDRGSTIHSIVEAFENTQEYIDGVPDKFRGYANAFYKWTKENKITIMEHEKTIFNDVEWYGGTLDLLVKINDNELPTVVDVKTGKDIYQEAWLQLSAYREALTSMGIATQGMAVLLLQEDGSYKYQYMEEDKEAYQAFLSCKHIWQWINREMISQMQKYRELKKEVANNANNHA